ncbi:MAG: hypothetical protein AAF146_18120 [Bacteroidota bacterium]
MGRTYSKATTTRAALRLELSLLLRHGYLRKNHQIATNYHWTNQRDEPAGNINLTSHWTRDECYLDLSYFLTSPDGVKCPRDYRINFERVPSNLGKGEVLYFICPVSERRCRVLYSAYGSLFFKVREAYEQPLYYPCQVSSKLDYANDRYWELEGRLKRLRRGKYAKRTYRGKPTKWVEREERLMDQQAHWNYERWQPHNLPLVMRSRMDYVREITG